MHAALIYQDRMRTWTDKKKVADIFSLVFGSEAWLYQSSRHLGVTPSHLQLGNVFLPRECGRSVDGGEDQLMLLHHSLGPLESLMTCINMGWMAVLVSW